MSKQKNIENQNKNSNFKRKGKKGEKKIKQKRIVKDKGPKAKGPNSPLYGANSPHPDRIEKKKEKHIYWWE